MKYHQQVLEVIYKAIPPSRDTIIIVNALLKGYSINDLVSNPRKFYITIKGEKLKQVILMLQRFL